MSKKPKLGDIPGIGPKIEEKLREAGIKTPLKLSRADPVKLAAKVNGLSEKKAATLIEAAKKIIQAQEADKQAKEEKPKKTVKKEKPKKKAPKVEEPKVAPKKKTTKKVEEKPEAAPKKQETKPEPPKKEAPKKKRKPSKRKQAEKPKKVTKKQEPLTRETLVDPRLWRIAYEKRRRQPKFHHEQAHRWVRVKRSWRKVRGIDSATREKRKGRPIMVSAGYRKPRKARGIHPSRYIEVLVHRPEELKGLDPELHAVRIGGTVGNRKRQEIISQADAMLIRVLNPGAAETVEEEELFADLEGIEDLEVD